MTDLQTWCTNPLDDDESHDPELCVCADGVDNDEDELSDYGADPDCKSAGGTRKHLDVHAILTGYFTLNR